MALNPRIMAIPPQPTNREEHIHRFLTSLPKPNPVLGSNDLQADLPDGLNEKDIEDTVDDKAQEKLEEPVDNVERGRGREGLEKVTPQKDLEVERRRYERKIRRRDKAAILNPKSPAEKKVKPEQEQEPPRPGSEEEAALPDSWWEEHRQRKRALQHPPDPQPDLGSRRTKVDEDIGRRRIGTEGDTRKNGKIKKEKVNKGGIPGLEMIRNYKPSIPITGSRLTMRPQSRGLFGNGVSSDPDLLRAITGRQSNGQRGPAKRITLRNSSEVDGDWRDEWRQKPIRPSVPPHQAQKGQGWGSNLPPPGNTQSTSWPSQFPSSDGPSLPTHSRPQVPPRSRVASSSNTGVSRLDPLAKYRQQGHGLGWVGSESAASRALPLDHIRTDGHFPHQSTDQHDALMLMHKGDNQLNSYRTYGTYGSYGQHAYPSTSGHQYEDAQYGNLQEGNNHYPGPGRDRAHSHRHESFTYDHYSYPQHQGAEHFDDHQHETSAPFDAHDPSRDPSHQAARALEWMGDQIGTNPNDDAVPPGLEPEMQDFWKRRTHTPHPAPPPLSRPFSTPGYHVSRNGPIPFTPITRPMTSTNNLSYPYYQQHTGESRTPPYPHFTHIEDHGNRDSRAIPEGYPTLLDYAQPASLTPTPNPAQFLHPHPHAQIPPFPPSPSSYRPASSFAASHHGPQGPDVDQGHVERRWEEREVEEYGTTTNDWKSLWSSKPYR